MEKLTIDILLQKYKALNDYVNKTKVSCILECISSYKLTLEALGYEVIISDEMRDDILEFYITIDDLISENISKRDSDFMELCKLSDEITISGIDYSELDFEDEDDEQTGVIITVSVNVGDQNE